jgi:hypothetical protein
MRGILKHDIYAGIEKNIFKILVVVLLVLTACFVGANMAESYGVENVSFSEIVAYIFGGQEPFLGTRGDEKTFDVPIVWLIMQIFTAYIVGSYPTYDLKTYGINLLVRTKNRYKWWLGKVVWCVALNVVIYLAGFITIFAFTGFDTENMWRISGELAYMYEYDFSGLNTDWIIISAVVMPLFTSIAMSLLQMMIMFVVNEVTAYGVILFLCAFGTYYKSPLFISSNSMMIRNADAYMENTHMMMCIVNIVVIILSVVTGSIAIKRKNIYGN